MGAAYPDALNGRLYSEPCCWNDDAVNVVCVSEFVSAGMDGAQSRGHRSRTLVISLPARSGPLEQKHDFESCVFYQ